MLRFFISYSSDDNEVAGNLERFLEDYGFSVFLAHEDIEPASDWVERILEELEMHDIFLPILTENFKNSNWTSQEVGIAYKLGKLVIPLKIHIDPYGFITKIQALSFDIKDVDSACISIIKAIYNQNKYRGELINSLIKGFANSYNFDNANKKSSVLKLFPDIPFEQKLEIIGAGINNSQIYDGFVSKPFIQNLIYSNLDKKDKIIDYIGNEIKEFFLKSGEKIAIDDNYVIKEINRRLNLKLES